MSAEEKPPGGASPLSEEEKREFARASEQARSFFNAERAAALTDGPLVFSRLSPFCFPFPALSPLSWDSEWQ